MKTLFAAALLAAPFAHAFYEEAQSDLGHRFYLSPEFFYNTLHETEIPNQTLPSKEEQEAAKKANQKIGITRTIRKAQGTALGMRGGYEYYAPNYIYAAVDGMVALGGLDYTRLTTEKGIAQPKVQESSQTNFASYEGRIGYTFEEELIVATPFFGFGGTWIAPQKDHSSIPTTTLGYVAAGARAKTALGFNFDLGLNAKVLRSLFGEQTASDASWSVHNWGYEFALPMIWHTSDDHWNFQIDPYLTMLPTQLDNQFFGAQFTLGHAF